MDSSFRDDRFELEQEKRRVQMTLVCSVSFSSVSGLARIYATFT